MGSGGAAAAERSGAGLIQAISRDGASLPAIVKEYRCGRARRRRRIDERIDPGFLARVPACRARARNGSAGWPSRAITRTSCPSSFISNDIALAAINKAKSQTFVGASGDIGESSAH